MATLDEFPREKKEDKRLISYQTLEKKHLTQRELRVAEGRMVEPTRNIRERLVKTFYEIYNFKMEVAMQGSYNVMPVPSLALAAEKPEVAEVLKKMQEEQAYWDHCLDSTLERWQGGEGDHSERGKTGFYSEIVLLFYSVLQSSMLQWPGSSSIDFPLDFTYRPMRVHHAEQNVMGIRGLGSACILQNIREERSKIVPDPTVVDHWYAVDEFFCNAITRIRTALEENGKNPPSCFYEQDKIID